MNSESRLEKITTNIVKIIFLIIIITLFLCSIFSSATMKKDEHTFYNADNPIIQIACIGIVCILITLIKVKNKKIKITRKKVIIGIVFWCIICVTWVFMTQLKPRADQKYILQAAENIKDGNFIDFEQDEYLYKNPHQLGMTLYLYILVCIFNQNAYLAAQVINIFAILIAFYSIYKIILMLYEDKNIAKFTLIGLFLFIPISLYITFIYGNLIGFAFSMLAVLFEFIYLKNEKKRYILPMAIFSALAIICKSNYMITIVAILILFIIEMIFRKKFKFIIPIIVIAISYIISGHAVNLIVENVTGQEVNKGTPMLSYIAMGLQEGSRAPGWYNGYSQKIYENNKYDYELTTNTIKSDITASIDRFKSNPKYTVEFFSQKIMSQWNNPTFQSFWIYTKRKSNISRPKIVKSILGTGKTNKAITEYMNIMQTIILFGAVVYIILNYKNIKLKELIFAIIFIGGFIFHLFWEAKGQYAITYFILLIPYSVQGYVKVSEKLELLINLNQKSK